MGSGLKLIFHLTDHSYSLFRSSFKEFVHTFFSYITAFKDTSSAKSLGLQIKLSGRSLINIKNGRGPRTEPWGTPDLIGFHEDFTPFITTLCFLLKR